MEGGSLLWFVLVGAEHKNIPNVSGLFRKRNWIEVVVAQRFLYWTFRQKTSVMEQSIWAILKVTNGNVVAKILKSPTDTGASVFWWEQRFEVTVLCLFFGRQFWEQHKTLRCKNPQNYWEKQKSALVLNISFFPPLISTFAAFEQDVQKDEGCLKRLTLERDILHTSRQVHSIIYTNVPNI